MISYNKFGSSHSHHGVATHAGLSCRLHSLKVKLARFDSEVEHTFTASHFSFATDEHGFSLTFFKF